MATPKKQTSTKSAAVKAAPKKSITKSAAKTSPVKSSVEEKTSPKKSRMTIAGLRNSVLDPKNRRSLYIAIIVILLAVIVYYGKNFVVAALVNGEPVSRIAVIQELEKQSGKATLENVITRKLIFQEASKKNIEVTDKEISAEIDKIRKQFKDQGQDLNQLLSAQGLTDDKFKEEVRIQILVTKLLGDQVKVTDKEFADFLKESPDLIAEEENQETAKAALRQSMEQQKLAQKYQEWIANIKKAAKVQYFVNY